MDGVLLVLDSRNLPNLIKAQPKRNRAVPAFATLILAIVLGMVYYVSIHRRAAQNVYTPPSAASVPEPSPEVKAEAPAEVKPEPVKESAVTTPAKKQTAKAASVTRSKTESEPKKEDSKVGSILKKTGHILKKPFKF
jgi:hypothetical protein